VLFTGTRIVDATPVEIDGGWWLFGAMSAGPRGGADELHLFRAESPFGPWDPHPRNPVKSDVRNSRPAGRLFLREGRWYRPAQDGSPRYGHSIVINRIEQLDDDAFTETVAATLIPDWRPGLVATHTVNAAGTRTLVDGEIMRRRWSLVRARE
jgi:hypothetical protein